MLFLSVCLFVCLFATGSQLELKLAQNLLYSAGQHGTQILCPDVPSAGIKACVATPNLWVFFLIVAIIMAMKICDI